MTRDGSGAPDTSAGAFSYVWTGAVLRALRIALESERFTEILPAILSSRFEPGARHSVAVLGRRALPAVRGTLGDAGPGVEVSGHRAYFLPVSHVVEKQIALEDLAAVYCVAPCVRLLMAGEPASGRHLYSFFQIEIEWRTESVDDVFARAERILAGVASALPSLVPGELIAAPGVAQRIASLAATPYPRVRFDDALARVRGRAASAPQNPHNANDLTAEEESLLASDAASPFWIHDYPEGVRDSLYRRNARGTYDTYDLMLPFGCGELLTGGLRPESADEVRRQSRALGIAVHPGYAEWKERTRIQSGGFGVGLERLVRYCCAARSVLDVRRRHDSGPNAGIELES
jgi:asparaginyl-tRNA synthetase